MVREKERSMLWSFIKRDVLVCLAVSMIAIAYTCAQTGTTSLNGVVTDKTGAAIVSAKVMLVNSGQGFTRETTTGPAGEYQYLALQPGTYLLSVEKTGFRKFEQKNLQLLINSPTTVNVALEIGVTSETIEVSAQAVTLNTTDASLGVAF